MAVSAGRLVSARQEFVGGRQRGRIRPLVSAIVALLLLGSVATGWTSTAHAAKSSVLVIDGNTGRTLHESAADEARYPASLTKMMTLYLVFEQIERGRLGYQTPIRASAAATMVAPSKLDLKEGDEIALIDAIKALVTKSANDVAVAIAEHIAGSEEKFARLMTAKARQLGMAHTTFRNASGLPDPEQITTARDMATLALRLQDDFPKHYPLFATRTFSWRGETFNNHNTLLFGVEGIDGIKTGYTRASGFNLVSSLRRGNKHVIGVVFGGASAATRNAAMRTFLNIGLVRASNEKTRKPATALLAQREPAEPVRAAAAPIPQKILVRPTQQPAAGTSAAVQPGQAIAMVRVRALPLQRQDTAAQPQYSDATPRQVAQPRAIAQPQQAVQPIQVAGGPGARPSSLGAQADRLAAGQAPTQGWSTNTQPTHLDASATARTALPQHTTGSTTRAVGGRFHVQIGAFPSAAEAERQLQANRARVAALAQAKVLTQPVQQGEKTLYRARYAGLDSTAAAQACEDLKKQGQACLVFKAD